ncbi:MAG TPA: NAD(P)(+) transhydrogenase (Re/Si-specific) subunit beta [Propionicimonas sp.]|jgi:NAD(P) transhydrogenase subunit beta|uniref:NAD(P)(+) transhydrogenase (Re/Si-specific) subunit beta n=1 Tax=Propionicimonas sp. TaxID=1955623 RepID=UPI002F40EF50
MTFVVNAVYLAVAILFILGLKAMSSPVTARKGIMQAGLGMILATVITFLYPGNDGVGLLFFGSGKTINLILTVVAIAIGGGVAWWLGKVVKMTDMPQMVAVYNGMGGGAAALIAAVEFARVTSDRSESLGPIVATLAVLGALIGSVAFAGSIVAFLKLQGIMKKTWRLPAQNLVNMVLALAAVVLGVAIVLLSANPSGNQLLVVLLVVFFLLSLFLGVVLTSPIGGADMPVVISLLNAFTGLAVGFEGYVLGNPALVIAGIVVGASGTLLTQLMAKAMNRPITNVIFTPITGEAQVGGGEIAGSMKELSGMDAAAMMRYAEKVIIIPGYGMAVAGAQHKVWELTKLLEEAGVTVKFAIHPVAGRMPGHMNVLLAEAGVPYDMIFDLEEINDEFPTTDVALVIGANDVVNPVARTDKGSPIYGMPILNADKAQSCIVIKRGKGAGYSGIENALFYAENTSMLYGSAQQAVADIITAVKTLV